MRKTAVWLAWAILAGTALGGEVGFLEDFALAPDRAVPLRQLIPGTEDYYYYHALHYLNTEQFEKAEEITRPWLARFGQTPRLTEIQHRHALLTYERNPRRALDYLRNRLGLRYDHQRVIPGAAPDLPLALDPKLIARETLRAQSMARWNNLDNFEDRALEWLAGTNLDDSRRRNLLQRLQRPDVPNLPRLIAEDLQAANAPPFGTYPIHRQLTLAQLEELVKLRPELLNQTAFVNVYLSKLHPSADEDWRHDKALALAYLERLWAFVSRLAPAHNGLKAHVLYHRLALDRTQGVYDLNRFLAYLQLPRRQPYMAKVLLENDAAHRFPADLNADFSPITQMIPIGTDEPLVRDYLRHFLLNADNWKQFEPYVNDTYLKHLFAEVKIAAGLGDPEQWASLLPPEQFRQLKERIDIDFAPTNAVHFGADEAVRLDVFVKNVPSLLVKVFEINTVQYYRQHQQEVDTDINLDGLVANVEQTHAYPEPALRRVARRFEFPQLQKPGVYVIDFIGNGKSSRALVRKGRLRPLVRTGTAGQVVTVVDEANQPVKDAVVWLGGLEYKPDADGRVILPFSTQPGRRAIVVSRGDFASLDHLYHQAEDFRLTAGIHVEREALLTQRTASVLVRPGLFLNGTPVAVKLLEEVKLQIVATDQAGISSATEVANFKLFEDREAVHEFRVPPRLRSLQITLRGRVKNLSLNKHVDLADGQTFDLNGIDRTDKIADLHLAKFGPDYVIELLGRTGEAMPDRAVQLALKHRDFKEPVHVSLKTDGQGRLRLGPLPDVATVTATGPEGTAHTWPLPRDRHTYRQTLHGRAGDVITLPYLGAAPPTREELALFELRGDTVLADRFDALAVQDGLLELRGLAGGDYELWLKESGTRILVRVAAGPIQAGFVLGSARQLELPVLRPVQIAAVTADQEQVTVRLADASRWARVHVFATRYRPAFAAFADLGRVRDGELRAVVPAPSASTYLTGRNIGDEYRYILDRRNQKKYPGNMLERPGLLLNPWAVRSTEAGEQVAQGGDDFSRRGVEAGEGLGSGRGDGSGTPPAPPGDFADLDYLADAAAVAVNLVPDKDGVIRLPRPAVGPHALIQVVAVDPLNTTARFLSLPEQPAKFRDLRLHDGLDPAGHFTQQQQISLLPPGQPFVLTDVGASRFEIYDSLAKVYGLYATLSNHDATLEEFAFLLTWPTLKPEDKREKYSKYACHELNFFLFRKDPAFFQTVIRPYLANKRDKTFLDRWLLGEDLSDFLPPWQYGRLNTVERILLAQRLPDELGKTARHLDDLQRLQPPDLERARRLFDTAVKGGALETGDPLGLRNAEREKLKAQEKELAEAKPGLQKKDAKSGAADPKDAQRHGFGSAGKPTAPSGGYGAAGGDSSYAPSKMPAQREGRSKDANGRFLDQLKKADEEGERLADSFGLGFGDDRERAAVRQLYRKVDPTMEWAENNYYHLPIQQQVAGLIPVSPFWLDYAKHDPKAPFLSRHLAEAARNFPEMALALAVLDLPFEAPKHQVAFADGRMNLTPAGPAVAFHEEVRPVEGVPGKTPVLVSQNYYRHGDRFREVDGEKLDKFVTGEFLTHTVYGCQVVVTNPTSSRQKLAILVQLPVGALPLGGAQVTRTVQVDLEPYRTQTVDYLFYFPLPGRFVQFPVHVAKGGQFLAAATPVTFEVVDKPSKLDTGSWDYVSQNGTNEEVLNFLGRENVQALDLEKIAFRMKDRGFFEAVLTLLRQRHSFNLTLWSYALFHDDPAAARQFLAHQDAFVAQVGGPLKSTLLTVDPIARHQYEHLEYRPLVNARAHALGQRRQIVNARIHEQYHHFLHQLAYHAQLSPEDRLAAVYYLLLQDRVDEALATFAQVPAEAVAERIQYDYCACYLQLFTDEPAQARAIAQRYANYPVDRWRKMFQAVLDQLSEGEKGPQVADAEDRGQRQDQLAATAPGAEFTLVGSEIRLTWQHVERVRINYYLMDVELLFSRNPFVQQGTASFAAIKPNATQEVALPAGKDKLAVPLPAELARRNVLVEVTAAGQTRTQPYFATAMDVKLQEGYGQLKVSDAANGQPLPKVYVKVYARQADGAVKFHKDGYTDHRGRFDYATVSTPERVGLTRFAVLVLSDDRGATIREVNPPQQ